MLKLVITFLCLVIPLVTTGSGLEDCADGVGRRGRKQDPEIESKVGELRHLIVTRMRDEIADYVEGRRDDITPNCQLIQEYPMPYEGFNFERSIELWLGNDLTPDELAIYMQLSKSGTQKIAVPADSRPPDMAPRTRNVTPRRCDDPRHLSPPAPEPAPRPSHSELLKQVTRPLYSSRELVSRATVSPKEPSKKPKAAPSAKRATASPKSPKTPDPRRRFDAKPSPAQEPLKPLIPPSETELEEIRLRILRSVDMEMRAYPQSISSTENAKNHARHEKLDSFFEDATERVEDWIKAHLGDERYAIWKAGNTKE